MLVHLQLASWHEIMLKSHIALRYLHNTTELFYPYCPLLVPPYWRCDISVRPLGIEPRISWLPKMGRKGSIVWALDMISDRDDFSPVAPVVEWQLAPPWFQGQQRPRGLAGTRVPKKACAPQNLQICHNLSTSGHNRRLPLYMSKITSVRISLTATHIL